MPKLQTPLSDKEAQFVVEYLKDLNCTQAAIRAGYSPRTARVIGPQLRRKPRISDPIDVAMAERSVRTGIEADRVLQEVAALAMVKLTDAAVWGKDGLALNDSASLTDADARAIRSVKVSEKFIKTLDDGSILMSRECEITLHEKYKSLDLLMRHLGLIGERGDGSGGGGAGGGRTGDEVPPKAYTLEDWNKLP